MTDEEMKNLLTVALRIVSDMRELSQALTPEGWGIAATYGLLRTDLHTNETALIEMARQFSMAYGPRFGNDPTPHPRNR